MFGFEGCQVIYSQLPTMPESMPLSKTCPAPCSPHNPGGFGTLPYNTILKETAFVSKLA